MRITVGHVVFVTLVGGGLYMGRAPIGQWVSQKASTVRNEFRSLSSFFHAGEVEAKKESRPSFKPSGPKPDLPVMKATPLQDRGVPVASSQTASLAEKSPAVQSLPTAKESVAKPVQKKKKVSSAKRTSVGKKGKKKKFIGKKKKKVFVKSKKKGMKKKVAAKKATTPKKTASSKKATGGVDRLMGSYVALELTTGRVVKGVLEKKSKTHYTIEIPGMGPFQYPVSKVKNVRLAK